MKTVHLYPTRQTRQPRLTNYFSLLMILCVSGLGLVACGKRRPPLPPVERVQQRTELLSAAQQGNEVILSWPSPIRNAPDSSVQSIRRIDVYRLAEKPGSPLALTEEEFSNRSTLIGSVPFEQIQNAGEKLSYTDTLELAGQPTRLRYAIRYVNASGQRAAFSNFVNIEPAAKIAQPPTLLLTGKEVTEEAVNLTWQAPKANIDGSTPVNVLGYNVYRMDQGQTTTSQTPINSTLVSGTEYADQTFKFGTTYRYVVRAVSLGTGGAQVESLNSNSISFEVRDTFAPAAPQGLSVTAPQIPRLLALFFAANKETDVVGYNLYRSTDPDAPKPWTKINQALLTRTTFQDDRVESGKKYYYYVVAVDNAGNVSQPSEVVSETPQ